MVAFLLTIVMVLSFFGCDFGSDEDVTEEVDDSKTQLYVSNYYAGLGDEWLVDVKARFENQYKDTEFENGKKGVQVQILNTTSATGVSLLSTMASSSANVFFTEYCYYYDLVNAGILADITDTITEKLTEFGENKSIEEKMTADQQAFYKTADKYYGIPFYESYGVIAYDVDLFIE
jgi:ABC-type glycerol-3-phosphate transport system substrate-binding protein